MKMTKQKLTKEQRKDLALEEYWKVAVPAYEEYEKVEQQALKKYEKVKQPAWKKYEKVRDLAYKKYKKVRELALEKYKEEYKKIDSEPDEIPEIIEHNGRKYKLIEGEK